MKITKIIPVCDGLSATVIINIENDVINKKYKKYPEMLYKYECDVTVKPKSKFPPIPSTFVTQTIMKTDMIDYINDNVNEIIQAIQYDCDDTNEIELNILV